MARAGHVQKALVEERHWVLKAGLPGRPRFLLVLPDIPGLQLVIGTYSALSRYTYWVGWPRGIGLNARYAHCLAEYRPSVNYDFFNTECELSDIGINSAGVRWSYRDTFQPVCLRLEGELKKETKEEIEI